MLLVSNGFEGGFARHSSRSIRHSYTNQHQVGRLAARLKWGPDRWLSTVGLNEVVGTRPTHIEGRKGPKRICATEPNTKADCADRTGRG